MNRLFTAISALIIAAVAPAAAREIRFQPDADGYTAVECDYQYIDLSATHQPLSLTPVPDHAAHDEGGAVIELPRALPFYRERFTRWVVSANGYLAAAESLSREDGGEYRNSCPLPFAPSNAAGSAARILPLQGDLEGSAEGAGVYAADFETCPRAEGAYGLEFCTVVQWHRWGMHGRDGKLDFQVVLYPSSGQIVFQYQTLDAELSGLAASIQSPNAASAVNLGCGMWQRARAGTAWCINPPNGIFRDRFE